MLKKPRPVDQLILKKMGVDAAGYSKAKERDVIRALNVLLDDPDLAKIWVFRPPTGPVAGSPAPWTTISSLRELNRKILESFFDPTLMAREHRKGGLHILGTERHESRRIDNQLRGRAGRQGDPGSSRFYLALDDELMRLFGNTERIQSWMGKLGMQEGENIEHGMVSRAIGHAQSKVEAMNFDIRKQLLDFDKVMSKQREAVYSLRNAVLEGENMTGRLESMMEESLDEKLAFGPGKSPSGRMGFPKPWRPGWPADLSWKSSWIPQTIGNPSGAQNRTVGPACKKPFAVGNWIWGWRCFNTSAGWSSFRSWTPLGWNI
jgi:hypothetical protein